MPPRISVQESELLVSFFFFFFTLVTGPRRSLSLKLSDTRVYEPLVPIRVDNVTDRCRANSERLRQ